MAPETWEYFILKNSEDFEVLLESKNSILEVYSQEGDVAYRSTHSLYHKGSYIKFLLKGTDSFHFISIFNRDAKNIATFDVDATQIGSSPSWLLWSSIALGVIVIALTILNCLMCICPKKKKNIHYVGVNDSDLSENKF